MNRKIKKSVALKAHVSHLDSERPDILPVMIEIVLPPFHHRRQRAKVLAARLRLLRLGVPHLVAHGRVDSLELIARRCGRIPLLVKLEAGIKAVGRMPLLPTAVVEC